MEYHVVTEIKTRYYIYVNNNVNIMNESQKHNL